MERIDIEWEIDGKKGMRSGKLYGLHEGEVMAAIEAINRMTRKGDTVTVTRH